jgi:hypothetical protein
MTAIHGAVEMVKLGDGLAIPADRLSPPLRRRWAEAMARRANGQSVAGVIEAIVRDVRASLGAELLVRAMHKAGPQSVLNLGLAEDAGPPSAARNR